MVLTIRDEALDGKSLHEMALEFLSEKVSVRQLIRERVYQEVREYNRRNDGAVFEGLVQPTGTEIVLNGQKQGFRLREPRSLDWEVQVERALEGFAKNSFFIIVDEQQVEDLDQEFIIGPATRVSFVKLVPLVGG
jgi:hypothetical protein